MNAETLRLLLQARRNRRSDRLVRSLQTSRLQDLVSFARTWSPYYRDLYRHLPRDVVDLADLPATDKARLMARFDDWATDRAVIRESVDAWVDDPSLAGEQFLGRYLVATTSGTSGQRGVFVSDDSALRVNEALSSMMFGGSIRLRDVSRLVAGRGRMAMVVATGGHFMVAAGIARMRTTLAGRLTTRVLSVHTPLPRLVEELNSYRPAMLGGYGSLMVMLAAEQEAGRLQIRPAMVIPAGETLSPAQRRRITEAFGCQIHDVYGSTECTFLTSGCRLGAYHVNSDWVAVEPVEADYTPTPVGQLSHTVLITNLANRVQPIIRYDLGDSVRQLPDPCACGNPMPVIEVMGRAANMLRFQQGDRFVSVPPLAFGTLIDHTPGVELGQVVQLDAEHLAIRLRCTPGTDRHALWVSLSRDLDQLLADYDLDQVLVTLVDEEPEQSPGGKFRPIIPMEPAR